MRFDFSNDRNIANGDADTKYPWGSHIPPLQASGNISYLQFIDVLTELWKDVHPEIKFLPYSSKQIYNPEKGYLIYSLERKDPAGDTPKPKVHEIVDHPTRSSKKVVIYRQSSHHVVKFTAIHGDSRTAEEIIEEFEYFMVTVQNIFQRLGLQHIDYVGRPRDEHDARVGQDIESRSSLYRVTVQTVLIDEIDKLQGLLIQVQSILNSEPATPNTSRFANVKTIIIDNYATPNY